MVLRLGLDDQLTHSESMTRVTVRTMEAPRNTHTVKVKPTCQNEISKVPMLRPGMTPRHLMLILQGKDGVCYCKIIDGAASDYFHSPYLSHDSLRLEANEYVDFRHVH